jgi:formylmethanofuran dehydrogenase subunit C
MTALTLRLRPEVDEAIDLSGLTPNQLLEAKPETLARIKLNGRAGRVRLADAFECAQGDASETAEVCIEGHSGLLSGVAAGLEHGSFCLRGHFGDALARGMRGGHVELRGRCGDFAATGMRGGHLLIRGEAGDHLGGALPETGAGMAGGTVVINGSAGHQLGNRMRRGLIIVNGDVGEYLGARMLAGTVMVTGQVGAHAGYNLRRGSLWLNAEGLEIPQNFADCGVTESVYSALFTAHLKRLSRKAAALLSHADTIRLYRGDLCNGGLGELLVFATS